MPKPRVFIAPLLADDLMRKVMERCEVVALTDGRRSASEAFRATLPDVHGVLATMALRFDRTTIAAGRNLRVLSNVAVGFDNIDLEAAQDAGVLVCNTPGVLDDAVADHTMGMIIALARRIVSNEGFARSGAWNDRPAPLGTDLRGKTLGLIGLGRIGKLVAQRASAFGMRAIYFKRSRDLPYERLGVAQPVEREQVFRQSDFVSIHTPLTPETRASVGQSELSLMKPGSYLINTSRGHVLDEAALVAALDNGSIAGAALDVMVNEPLPLTDPLLSAPNLILQPHAGSATTETRRAMFELAVRNLIAGVSGERPETLVI